MKVITQDIPRAVQEGSPRRGAGPCERGPRTAGGVDFRLFMEYYSIREKKNRMNRLRLNFIVFCVASITLILGLSSTLTALDPDKAITQYTIHIWNMEGGLPGNSIYAIQQTGDGYLWIATPDGLVRFDGLNFELYDKQNVPELNGNHIRALYVDREDTLWIGTSYGGLTRYKKGDFKTFPITRHRSLHKIRAIDEDRWGNLWIGSYTRGLTCFSGGNFTPYSAADGLPGNQVRAISRDGDGDLWVVTGGGIVKIVKPGIFQTYTSLDNLPHLHTSCFYDTDKKNLWIGTGDSGLYCLQNGIVNAYGVGPGGIHPTINTLFRDKMRNLWIGTDGGGLTRIKGGKSSTLSGANCISCGFIYSLYEDKEGSLWMGTLDGGLHQLMDGKFTTYTTREGLVHDDIQCICACRTGGLWIGSKGGVNRLQNRVLTTELTTREGLLNNSILSLHEDPDGFLWIGTYEGLHRYKPGDPASLTRVTTADGLPDNRIRSVLVDSRGHLWIGTQNGLNRYNTGDARNTGEHRFTHFTTKDGLTGNYIWFLFEDSRGELWIGTDTGLNRFKDGEITAYKPEAWTENNFFRCAYEDSRGVLWFGADSGLMRLDQDKTTLYTTENGLIENYVNSIIEDDRGYLWLGGRNGISRIPKAELEGISRGEIHPIHLDSYNEEDGMKSRWCSAPACKTSDGRFWFPTVMGIAAIDPNHIKTSTLAPGIIIEKMVADGETFLIHNKVKNGEHIRLTPGTERLQFYYTAVSFINSQKMKFKSRLAGYESDWIDMGTARTSTYTRLSPGEYTFKVTGSNPDGIWSEEGAAFSFYLEPRFTQTPWFYLSAGLFILLAAFFLYRYRVRQLRAREKELSSLVESRTRDLIQRNFELGKAHQKLRQSKEIIEEKNRHIMASMQYASKIQAAMLPIRERMENELEEHFVIYRPKDIVSGDFYWFDVIGDYYFLAVADCTGHGVPGALLSMIGYMMLNEAVKGLDMLDPAMILDYLHQGFRSVLKQEIEMSHTNDGMDIGLARIDVTTGEVLFAGAGRPLYLVSGSELVEIKGDRKSIGGRQREAKRFFTNREFVNPDRSRGRVMLYLMSDGFVGQHNPDDRKYGSRRLKKFLRDHAHLSAYRQKEALLKELKAHQADMEQRDDITVIGIRIP